MNLYLTAKNILASSADRNFIDVEITGTDESDVLNHFNIKEIIEHFGEDELLKQIGEKRAIKYFEIEVKES